ncbi:MAG TPA: hypothetical protein VGP02_02425 [Mycobacteriales bacterium]|nr:hypothetical protein [Mycobacteriales bacterium]
MAGDEAPRPGFPASLSIDAMVKVPALVGTVTYGCLFLPYRSYCSRLHVYPGDVGVDNLYILSRCIGFLVVSAVVGQGTSAVTARTTIDGRTEFVKLPVTSVAVVIHE